MIWRDIDDFPGYQVSSIGLVRNIATSRVLSCKPRKDGYVSIIMSHPGGKKKRAYAHRLVAAAFISAIPEGFTVNHKNLDKSDNMVENLEIVTQAENIQHAQKAGLYEFAGGRSPKGDDSPHSKLCGEQILDIRARHKSGASYKSLAAIFCVSNVQIRNIVTRKSWRHLP